MRLEHWYLQHPKAKRAEVRQQLAAYCQRSEISIRAYLNGHREVPGELFHLIEAFTGGKVSSTELSQSVYANRHHNQAA